MRVDGRLIAQKIFTRLKGEINKLKTKPHLAVVLVGENPVWKAYVGQKLKKGEEIGARVTVKNCELGIKNQELIKIVEELNNDPGIHGVIIQRPLPLQLDKEQLALAVIPKKDVDGFHPQTLYPMPVAAAVIEILKEIYQMKEATGDARGEPAQFLSASLASDEAIGQDKVSIRVANRGPKKSLVGDPSVSFAYWLTHKNIVVIGKGETAGKPTAAALSKLGAAPTVIDSKTPDPEKLIKSADIIISCIGKPKVIKPEMLKKGVILIGVGLHRDAQGKLTGDYKEEEIRDVASFYTPIPGGVGPVNVACLFENLVKAVKILSRT